jgi:penicillin V acylase-like amidase (Ntn superfamily)
MCTRVFWNADQPKVVGRTLDWEVSDEPRLWYLPTGITRSGGVDRAAEWSARYPSLSMAFWGLATSEAVNDAGLAAHLLYFAASDFGPRDDRPGVSMTAWAQYTVDNFATVDDALAGLANIQIVQDPVRGQVLGAHLAIEDAAGDSAIVEHLDGRAVVHHGPEHVVTANDPSYDEQVAGLARYRPFGGTEELPGDILSPQRFARATYFLDHLPPPRDERDAVAGVLGVTRNVAVPFGAPYDDFSVYPTWWVSVTDLTDAVYYFQSTRAPNVVWADLRGPAFTGVSEPRAVDPTDPTLSGDISAAFEPRTAPS